MDTISVESVPLSISANNKEKSKSPQPTTVPITAPQSKSMASEKATLLQRVQESQREIQKVKENLLSVLGSQSSSSEGSRSPRPAQGSRVGPPAVSSRGVEALKKTLNSLNVEGLNVATLSKKLNVSVGVFVWVCLYTLVCITEHGGDQEFS